MSTRTYTVTGMSCGHCENAVREEVGALDGVSDVTVSAETGTLTLDAPDAVTDDDVLAAVYEAGYTATRAE
ncbi:heavy-metal-associated domain-containing protein [Corynebacterium bovis]|uniref:Copper chaperone CopZ n=1 Tax=Corynebacterium bovis DSM 20582 = CIP 54.80 TaxID=927655 RepID=A0A8H9Y5K8_9CORY|nr:cation transporter [Corynebacterium bovis]MBB3114830.1 copper chaperone CopZ [Corynebacterium bovis DSM 20582 = CIP 54.80]QQC48157.1 heavy-metal-associated domain-containing protein [Corynebacterium bovis]WJY78059.1 Copper chaperone CopZ [Corynebacterium bovis DSM 20582 = CIP 54.80]